ncbi:MULTISPECIES: tyrosine-type recombinase/integrase [unclassified Streptomyces]|uniref:tyrosine-type recombinase/integrase n=2 Tax=unclassified Streptomyces TaxID=2593676 RepID=UPI000D0AAAD3|nr:MULTISPECIES: tyrosine-type recombinase/integrase [unclassified Streptomyces]MYX35024.1 tyrosine-type recombinase/integrase [Streptomyces sp. SID8377]
MMASRKRNPNGAGSIWQRKDGRYEARVYVPQPDGTRKRKTVYGSTWEECDEKRQELVRRDRQGIPTPSRSAKLSEWLPYWLEEYIRPHRKRTTYVKYEMHVRLYLVPLLGSRRLESLNTANVRRMVSEVTAQTSAATAREAHRVLRTALTAACREELISRNVVQLVPAPQVEPRALNPWTLDETLTFLESARGDGLYPAFVLAVALGLRRGEILGLQWRDVDLERRTLTVRTTLHRGGKELYLDTTKNRRTRAIPIPLMCVAPLRWQRLRQSAQRASAGGKWHDSDLVFTTRSGLPIEPRNLYRSFLRIASSAELPQVRLHDTRHGCASLLFAAGIAPRTVMEILGHSQIAVTMNVYTHVSDDSRREAMSHMDRLLKRRR